MKCIKHIDVEADGMCTYCGKPFCKECLVEVDGKLYCKDDLTRVFKENKSSTAQSPNIIINNSNNNVNTNTNTNTNNSNGNAMFGQQKSKMVALLLCFFLGYIGAHRFYVGKTGTGLIYLLTGGLFGIGVLFDFVMIIIGNFRDKWGRVLI